VVVQPERRGRGRCRPSCLAAKVRLVQPWAANKASAAAPRGHDRRPGVSRLRSSVCRIRGVFLSSGSHHSVRRDRRLPSWCPVIGRNPAGTIRGRGRQMWSIGLPAGTTRSLTRINTASVVGRKSPCSSGLFPVPDPRPACRLVGPVAYPR